MDPYYLRENLNGINCSKPTFDLLASPFWSMFRHGSGDRLSMLGSPALTLDTLSLDLQGSPGVQTLDPRIRKATFGWIWVDSFQRLEASFW